MAQAFTPDWGSALAKACINDDEFQTKIAKFDRTVTAHILPSPEHGVTEEITFGFDFPSMDYWFGAENGKETDYIFEGTYDSWYRVNEGVIALVPALMDQEILLPKGSVSYVARFVQAVERYFDLSRAETDSYAGDYGLWEERSV